MLGTDLQQKYTEPGKAGVGREKLYESVAKRGISGLVEDGSGRRVTNHIQALGSRSLSQINEGN